MVHADAVWAAVAYVSAVICTLRAGSRIAHVTKHKRLGILDGPLIVEGSPLWEPALLFREAVRLSLDHHDDDTENEEGDHTIAQSSRMDDNNADEVAAAATIEGEESTVYLARAEGSAIPPSFQRPNVLSKVIPFHREPPPLILPIEVKALPYPMSRYGSISTASSSSYNTNNLVVSSLHPTTKNKESIPVVKKIGRGTGYFETTASYLGSLVSSWTSLKWASTGRIDGEATPLSDGWWSQNSQDEMDYDATTSSTVQMPDTESNSTRISRVTAYAPRTFSDLRSRFGIDEEEFERVMTNDGPYVSFQSNSKGAARAGTFFFFTQDGAYMVKTVKKMEAKAFLEMLGKYHQFMKQNSKRSLLTRCCGMYGIKTDANDVSMSEDEDDHVFIVMNSVFPSEGSHFIDERFDLKGSTVGRQCSSEEREKKGRDAVLKDLDLATGENGTIDSGIYLGKRKKADLMNQLRKDAELLVECGVMDYSLLVGVAYLDKPVERRRIRGPWRSLLRAPVTDTVTLMDRALSTVVPLHWPYYGADRCGVDGGALSVIPGRRLDRRALFYMGVIDFLQPWTTRKVLERDLKGLLGYDKQAISCVAPKDYASRFLKFMENNLS